jgi:predicted neuraminidase
LSWLLLLATGAVARSLATTPQFESSLIFAPEPWHNHASCIVECPNGDLLVCWYHGSGERNADDVQILGARRKKGKTGWSDRFTLADTPDFPDTNPCLLIDPQERLWLFWQTLVANRWETALCRYKTSSDYQLDGPPRWATSEVLLFQPGPDFAETVEKQTRKDLANLDKFPTPWRDRVQKYLLERIEHAHDKYYSRMGWMTRAHPLVLNGKRLIVPLYSDGYNFSLMALSDDWGHTWVASSPLVGPANVQPSVVARKDGVLVAYMRNNGPPPKRLFVSESRDGGKTWSPVKRSELPNPGSGAEVVRLRNGHWVMAYNDLERGRHSLALSVSDDEGKTWIWSRHLEHGSLGPDRVDAAYPSIIQARDGSLHVTYTYTLNGKLVQKDAHGQPGRECIKHVHLNEEWIRQERGG